MTPLQLSVVLVEPQGALNIGSACRAMLNFGCSSLRLVNPQVDHLSRDARLMAVKAASVLESARVFESLEDALSDTVLSFGTTRRFGRYREGLLHPDEAADRLLSVAQKDSVALVFGREDRGLFTSELDLCQHFITIPTNENLPSMNLAQAVSICLYEVSRAKGRSAGLSYGRKGLANNAALESMYQHMRQTLLDIGYLDPQNPDHILRSFRRILSRSGLNDREVRILRGLFNQIDIYSGRKLSRRSTDGDHE
ncbi:tRNA/rRNA methyltransferase [Desulfuromusa kysingii]|uniref:tRNA (cytidine/uridine-2'-O-)-methyltransferase TrmJ n=1 Tax=Desulfuromusa kysingii TaxID=37625 RepID=A0A1H4D0W5_9BACT|nr:RNA methyltransferase [Desulfuromusa kysingii]SEA66257.1 tRNA/rRNA methyltransferase [Desulfuromusa kysingii]